MKILTFDTCLDKMYVTIADDEKILSSKIIETTKENYHSAFLISTIKERLKENSLKPKDVDIIATNIGPGSFTGIRACTTVARVFAQACSTKAVGVSSLEILSKLNTTDKKTLVALDARKEMVYVAIYDRNNQILEPQTILIEKLKEIISEDNYFIITDDKLQPIFSGISYQQSGANLGEFLARIVFEKIQTDVDTDWKNLHPLYIQPPPVTMKKIVY